MNRNPMRLAAILSASAFACLSKPLPIQAHHATGKPPETILQGLLSGLAHPVIGPDHFLFLLLLGTLACGAGARSKFWRFGAVAAALVGSVAGALALVEGIVPPAVEPFVALSIIGGGALVALRPQANGGPGYREAAPNPDGARENRQADRHRRPIAGLGAGQATLPILVMVASVFHGYTFAESALGAPATVFGTYLLGLSLAQAAIILGVARVAARTVGAESVHGSPRVSFAVRPAAGVASVLTGGLLLGSLLL